MCPVKSNAEKEDTFDFDFGPNNSTMGEFALGYTVVIRENAAIHADQSSRGRR